MIDDVYHGTKLVQHVNMLTFASTVSSKCKVIHTFMYISVNLVLMTLFTLFFNCIMDNQITSGQL